MADKELKIVIGGDSSGGESALRRIAETASGVGLERIIEKVASFGMDFIKDSMEIANETEKMYRQLDAVLASTGRSAEISKGEIDKLASSLAANSEFSKSAMVNMEIMLVQYDKIGKDVLPRASQAMIDFAARTNRDPVEAARALGMALQEPYEGLNRLRTMGVKVSEEQKKLMDSFKATGNSAKAQELIINALNKQYSGAASANIDEFDRVNKQLAGTIKALQVVIGTYILQALTPLAKALIPILDTFKQIITGQTSLQKVLKLNETAWVMINAAIKPLAIVITTLLLPALILSIVQWGINTAMLIANTVATTAHAVAVAWVTVVTNIWTAAQWLLNVALSANPIGLVIIAVAALAAGIIWAYQNVEWFRDWVNILWENLKFLANGIQTNIVPIILTIVDAFMKVVRAIQSAIDKIREFIGLKNQSSGNSGGAWASGGLVSGGGMALVGEMGPELVNLPAGSFVNQSASTRSMLSGVGSSGSTVNIYNPSVRNDGDIREIVRQVKKALGRENELVRLGAL